MGKVNTSLCLLLVVMLTAVSLLAIQLTYAQSIPKPSVPHFTINYVEFSRDIEPTYTIDPFTGQTQMTRSGNTVIVKNIEVVIKNQAFSPYQTADGNYTQLEYYVRAKGYYEQWITDSINEGGNIILHNNRMRTAASNSDTTILTFPLNYWNIKPGGQIDFQVKAVIANYYTVQSHEYYIADYVGSDVISEAEWSPTQTLTIPAPNGSPAPSPTVPELPWVALLPLCLIVLGVALVLKYRKKPPFNVPSLLN